jgi:hypothetical protein
MLLLNEVNEVNVRDIRAQDPAYRRLSGIGA